ncbi:MAG: hypothetical protein JST80_09120 [Bdellovibrionales bacterium]|nr:hypothetical protein [Bdellovibrionales bacterium]
MLQDIFTIGALIILEGILSIDNALVLAVLARSVDAERQQKVLTYGLIGAIVLRMVAIYAAKSLLENPILKIFGSLYLLYLAVKFFFFKETEHETKIAQKARSFWITVALVEMTDLAFAVDSILAAVALTSKYWLIVTGGLLGTVMMRFAAKGMITMLNRYPKLETTAYLLIAVVGLKLGLEACHIPGVDFHSTTGPWFWGQWISMALAIAYGFKKQKSAN